MVVRLNVPRYRQGYMECGPICLKQVMEYFDNVKYEVKSIIKETKSKYMNNDWIFLLAIAAMKRGFKAKVITLSTEIFDPSWSELDNKKLVKKFKKRLEYLKSKKNKDYYIRAFNIAPLEKAIEFIEKGGNLVFSPIYEELIEYFIKNKIPVIVTVNENIFYGIKRLYNEEYDDIRGNANGHMVVISGFDKKNFIITDPERLSDRKKGIIKRNKKFMLNCILTFSPNLLIIYKK
ncbi:MAG: C39 family peptidase [Candidatus Aenigmarchaeota archaeon]|nr:C39 family peptidase [Candidatus Aenigmarchaeota archaeon]